MDVSNPSQFFQQRFSPTRVIQWEFQSNRLCTDISAFPPTEGWKEKIPEDVYPLLHFLNPSLPLALEWALQSSYLLCTWISAPFLWGVSPQKWQANPRTETVAGEGEVSLGWLARSDRAGSFLLRAGFHTSHWKLRRKKKRGILG